jgi:branched-subunit amino acid ABC-type transport system permease component
MSVGLVTSRPRIDTARYDVTVASPEPMSTFLPLFVFGLIDGAIFAVAALGFTLQFGITNVVNFAYGEFITFGAYGVVIVNALGVHMSFWPTLIVGGLSGAVLSFVIGRFLYGPFFKRRSQLLFSLVLTFAVSLILFNLYLVIWGSGFRVLDTSSYPAGSADVHTVAGVTVTTLQLLFVVYAVICLVGAQLVLKYTRLGKSMRAIADNRDLATVCGLNLSRITNVTWLITGFLAGSAGIVEALQTTSFAPNLGDTFLYLVFASVVLGGIGRPVGAVLGAVIIGLVTQLSVPIVGSEVSPVSVFVVLVVLMLFRPQGLFGSTGRTSFAGG